MTITLERAEEIRETHSGTWADARLASELLADEVSLSVFYHGRKIADVVFGEEPLFPVFRPWTTNLSDIPLVVGEAFFLMQWHQMPLRWQFQGRSFLLAGKSVRDVIADCFVALGMRSPYANVQAQPAAARAEAAQRALAALYEVWPELRPVSPPLAPGEDGRSRSIELD